MNDFDFFVGSWDVANRRRRELFADCDEWDEFPATSVCRLLLDGVGMVDEMDFPTLGAGGMTVGFQDRESGEWSLYWVSARDGILSEPVVGEVKDGNGEFFGEAVHEGRPVRVRNAWFGKGPDEFRWEQSYALNTPGGQGEWEPNWTMDFTRVRAAG